MIIRKGTFGTKKFSEIGIKWNDNEMLTHKFKDDLASNFTVITDPAKPSFTDISIASTPTYTVVTKPTAPTITPAV